jgi:hypothetical protein
MDLLKGIVVGCDQNQEWLLSWWWNHYCKHNSYPVVFVDFGLTEKARLWCRERGQVLSLKEDCHLKKVPTTHQKAWETRAGPIWPFRSAWFKKPLAALSAPFEYSCWIDLDCEIKGPLEPLFTVIAKGVDIALVPEPENVQRNDLAQNLIFPGEITYNSGVFAFRKNSPILNHWAKLSLEQNHRFMGDQNALSRAIFLHSPPLAELPAIYNWKKSEPPNPDAVIIHYIASSKVEIVQSLISKDIIVPSL